MEELLPLSGIRILEFGYYVAGPLTRKLFTDFGAERYSHGQFCTTSYGKGLDLR
ncbi:CoA transferase [Thermodesulfobacteriota bacterium]